MRKYINPGDPGYSIWSSPGHNLAEFLFGDLLDKMEKRNEKLEEELKVLKNNKKS